MRKVPEYSSWNLIPEPDPAEVVAVSGVEEAKVAVNRTSTGAKALCFGMGRSYGDVCINNGGLLVLTSGLKKILSFEGGILEVEAGATFGEIIAEFLPRGWFPPTTPGTKFVTIGGAIANDVHGKNQHSAGSFGNWVRSFRLLRSDGCVVECSRDSNADLFRATIGGLGLTGMILSARFQMVPVPSPFVRARNFLFRSLPEFYSLSRSLPAEYEFLFSWLDPSRNRGVVMAGNWHASSVGDFPAAPVPKRGIPGGRFLLNRHSMRIFNVAYWLREKVRRGERVESWNKFFYPLDHISQWNRLYGPRGFFEYQCLVPAGTNEEAATAEILSVVRDSRQMPYLAAIKRFGPQMREGTLSFPGEGTSLIFDFAQGGGAQLELFRKIDELVLASGGRIYPAKDARMPRESFLRSFPELDAYREFVDPKFSSSFWRRVNS